MDLGAIYQAILAVAADVRSFRAEVKAEFGNVRAEMRAEMADLRQAVADYHGAVIGHGVLIGELDERVRRLEQDREPPEAA